MLKAKNFGGVFIINVIASIGVAAGTLVFTKAMTTISSTYKRAAFKRKIKSVFKKKEKIEEEKILKFKCSED